MGGAKKSDPPPKPVDDEATKKAAFEAQRQAVRAQERKKRRIDELEKMIADGEQQLVAMRAKLKEDPAAIGRSSPSSLLRNKRSRSGLIC